MAEVQSWSQLAIVRTIAAPGTGTDVRITFGSLVTGHGGMASKCGFAAITSCEDTEPRNNHCRNVSDLPSRDQSAQQTEKSADERFRKIMAL